MIVKIRGEIPSKANGYQIGKTGRGNPVFLKNQKVRDFEKRMAWLLTEYPNPLISGTFKVKVVFYYQSKMCDIDGGLKSFLDTLQKSKWIKNDRDCMELHVIKRVDKLDPRIEFEIDEKL